MAIYKYKQSYSFNRELDLHKQVFYNAIRIGLKDKRSYSLEG